MGDLFGGPDIPPPDPSIGEAQKQMAELAVRQQDFFEKNLAPELIAQLKASNATQAAVGSAQIASMNEQLAQSKQFNERYWNTQVPLEDKLIKQATDYNTAANREQMAGQVGADFDQATAAGNQNLVRGLQMRGIDLGSGASLSAMANANTQATLAKAGAMNKTREVARQLGWSQMGEAAALGRGLPGFGATSAQLATGAANSASNAGTAGVGGTTATAGAFNQQANTQGTLWGNYGNLGVGSYQGQLQGAKIQADNDPFNAILGAATGVGMMYGLKKFG